MARTVIALRRVAIVLGLMGGVMLAAFAAPIATLTFGDGQLTWAVALLGLAVLFRLVADAQGALLQGMRRIGDLARAGVFGAIAGTVATIALVFWLRENGVALAIVAGAALSLCTIWYYTRKVRIERVPMPRNELLGETKALLQLGLAFMASALLTMGAAYVVRIILIRSDGLEGAGLYQAAWAIGGLYVNFVLQAMGTDFYPRLVGAAADNAECNRLVNEQAMVSLLLAGVGVTATLTLAPWVLTLLYSDRFTGATEMLRWVCLGMALRVLTWPLGYILVAKGKRTLFVAADLIWTVLNIALTWLFVRWFGLVGAGIAFFASYAVHFFVVYPMCRKASDFRWSSGAARTVIVFVVAIALASVQAGFVLLPPIPPARSRSESLPIVLSAIALGFLRLSRLVLPQNLSRTACVAPMRLRERQKQ